MLALAAATAAGPAFAQQGCQIGARPHEKGKRVFLDCDQVELDAAYFQPAYEPNSAQVIKRYASNSEITRTRLGQPQRVVYGPTDIENLDIYRTKRPKAPIFVFIHGGAWRTPLYKCVINATVVKTLGTGSNLRTFLLDNGYNCTEATDLPGKGRLALRDNYSPLMAGDRIEFRGRIRKPLNRGTLVNTIGKSIANIMKYYG